MTPNSLLAISPEEIIRLYGVDPAGAEAVTALWREAHARLAEEQNEIITFLNTVRASYAKLLEAFRTVVQERDKAQKELSRYRS